MREILFRGKRIDNGEWVEGYYYRSVGRDIIAASCDYIVDPSTVGQYTGLTDKNGKRIFEGDILEHNNCGLITRDVVVYDRWNCSCCDGVYGYALLHHEERFDFREVKWSEICGNIHDNPELLEVGE